MTSNLSSGPALPLPERSMAPSSQSDELIIQPATRQAGRRPTVAAIVVSYNTRELLRGCLESLERATLPLRVLVVDNGSSDGSVELVRRAFPAVELIEAGANLGFACGNNLALRRLGFESAGLRRSGVGWGEQALPDAELLSGGREELPHRQGGSEQRGSAPAYVLLINPDAELLPGALEQLLAFMEQHPRVGVAAPRLRYLDGSHQAAAFRFPTLLMSFLDFFPPRGPLLGRLYASPLNGRYPQDGGAEPFAIDHPLGAAMLVRAETMRQVGLLDERYWLYAEEVDWCYRMRQAGWAIWQVPAAEAIHVAGAASSQFRARSFLALQRSRLIFFERFYSPRFLRWQRRLIRAAALRDLLKGSLSIARGRGAEQLKARMLAAGELLALSQSHQQDSRHRL